MTHDQVVRVERSAMGTEVANDRKCMHTIKWGEFMFKLG